jgi:hypothetical protein
MAKRYGNTILDVCKYIYIIYNTYLTIMGYTGNGSGETYQGCSLAFEDLF